MVRHSENRSKIARYESPSLQDAASDEDSRSVSRLGAAKERMIWWKVDKYVIPMAILLYFFSWLDRTNVGNASVAGLQRDLRMTPRQYSIALTVTFVPYILVELPSNLVLKTIGPNRLLPGLLLSWGIVATCQGLVHNYAGFVACRFFLGLCEGGLYPGLIVWLSSFYPRDFLQLRIAIVGASVSLAGAFSGLLAFAISNMHGVGGRPAWAWIFILEGAATICFGIVAFWILPVSPASASFLNGEERKHILTTLREGHVIDEGESDKFAWHEVRENFKLPHFWFLFIVSFLNGVFNYGVGYFAPSIVFSLGFSSIRTQLMTIPPLAVGFVVNLVAAYLGDRYHTRGIIVIFSSLCSIIGISIFLSSTERWVLYGSLFFLIGGSGCGGPAFVAWQANNTSPYLRRATGVAMLAITNNAGGILSTWLLGSLSPAPRYTKAMVVMLVFSCLIVLFAGTNIAYLSHQNKKKKEIRQNMRKEDEPAGLGDRSAWFVYIL
ncbi:hypothetical protein NP233_g1136 [Leucocoprinus birnbaumii]|uniref:Major facilitator superfamily (MFS) profile domain-containing protein n=1 Tax=Leucocoprinus birnbaumii TaxID=56174 RepID=A0AAD5YZV0_9AGAR|nr:hypothetical protein NP233_g1136 [Leucocoprinus birnbaumii]